MHFLKSDPHFPNNLNCTNFDLNNKCATKMGHMFVRVCVCVCVRVYANRFLVVNNDKQQMKHFMNWKKTVAVVNYGKVFHHHHSIGNFNAKNRVCFDEADILSIKLYLKKYFAFILLCQPNGCALFCFNAALFTDGVANERQQLSDFSRSSEKSCIRFRCWKFHCVKYVRSGNPN